MLKCSEQLFNTFLQKNKMELPSHLGYYEDPILRAENFLKYCFQFYLIFCDSLSLLPFLSTCFLTKIFSLVQILIINLLYNDSNSFLWS